RFIDTELLHRLGIPALGRRLHPLLGTQLHTARGVLLARAESGALGATTALWRRSSHSSSPGSQGRPPQRAGRSSILTARNAGSLPRIEWAMRPHPFLRTDRSTLRTVRAIVAPEAAPGPPVRVVDGSVPGVPPSECR